ncbi:MAG: hypothetical protein ABL953_12280 [Ilumatobacteraceae bacterium]
MSLEELHEQRRFLLDSIRDLEREHEVGDITAADFQVLRDGYIARAATVMREIDGQSSKPTPRPRKWARRLVIVAATLAVAVALGLFVAQSAGQRLPGQSLTGGQPADEVAVQLAEGRRLLHLEEYADSRAVYERVQESEPGNVEATTYLAWLAVLIADEAGDVVGVQEGVQLLAEATTLDETYADPHCLLAIALYNFTGDSDSDLVQREADTCLALDPPADMLPLIDEISAADD